MTSRNKNIIGAFLAALLFAIAGVNLRSYFRDRKPLRDPRLARIGTRVRVNADAWNSGEAALIESTVLPVLESLFDWMDEPDAATAHDRKLRELIVRKNVIRPLRSDDRRYRADRIACYDPLSQDILLNGDYLSDTLEAVVGLLRAAEQGLGGEEPPAEMRRLSTLDEIARFDDANRRTVLMLRRDIEWIDRIDEWYASAYGPTFIRARLGLSRLHRRDLCLQYELRRDLCYFSGALWDLALTPPIPERLNHLQRATLELAATWALDVDYEPLGQLTADLRRLARTELGEAIDSAFQARLDESAARALEYRLLHPIVERQRAVLSMFSSAFQLSPELIPPRS